MGWSVPSSTAHVSQASSQQACCSGLSTRPHSTLRGTVTKFSLKILLQGSSSVSRGWWGQRRWRASGKVPEGSMRRRCAPEHLNQGG